MNLTPVVLQCMILKSHRLQRVCFSCVWIHLYVSVVKAFNQICSFCNANKYYFLWTCVLSAVSALTALIQELDFCVRFFCFISISSKFSSKVHFDFPSLRTFTFLSAETEPTLWFMSPFMSRCLMQTQVDPLFPGAAASVFSACASRCFQCWETSAEHFLFWFYFGFGLCWFYRWPVKCTDTKGIPML